MSEPPPARGTCIKVLFVEDSITLQLVLTNAVLDMPGLKLAGVVDSAADAIAAFALHRPDIVVLDLVLRAGNGLDVLQTIKADQPTCCVLIFTGHDGEAFRRRCRALGADDFFSKKSQHQELMQRLRELGAGATDHSPTPEELTV